MSNRYTVRITTLAGVGLDEINARGLSWTRVISDAGTATGQLLKHQAKTTRATFEPGQRLVEIYRAGVFRWGGFLGSLNGGAADEIAFAAVNFWDRMKESFIDDADRVYADEEELDVAWDLIDYAQGKTDADIGITRDPNEVASGVLVSATYTASQRPGVADSITTLANGSQGFEFEVTPERIWRARHPALGAVSGAVFELGKNVSDYTYLIDGGGIVTDLTAIGGTPEGEDTAIISTASDATARGIYGRREAVLQFTDVLDQDTLDDLAAAALAAMNAALEQPVITALVDDVDAALEVFDLGDQVKVRISDGFYQVDDYFRAVSMKVTVTDDGEERAAVTFDKRVGSHWVPRPTWIRTLAGLHRRVNLLERR